MAAGKWKTCKECSQPAVKVIIWADGRAGVPACGKHVGKIKSGLSDVVAVRNVEDMGHNKKADEHEEESKEISAGQRKAIEEFVKTHKIKDDDVFHRFVESIGVEPHDAEVVVYNMAYEGANEGLAAKEDKKPEDFDMMQLAKGVKVELEHTNDREKALRVAMDHLTEFPNYYDGLSEMERKLKQQKKALEKEGGLKIPKKFKLKKEKLEPVKLPGEKKDTIAEKVVERARKFMKRREG